MGETTPNHLLIWANPVVITPMGGKARNSINGPMRTGGGGILGEY